MIKKIFKILEITINSIALIWLAIVSFVLRPRHICIYHGNVLNYQYGLVYLMIITFTITCSLLIIWRLFKPGKVIRIITIFSIMGVAILTYMEYRNHSIGIEEILRRIIFGREF
jgi:hypothetical protein